MTSTLADRDCSQVNLNKSCNNPTPSANDPNHPRAHPSAAINPYLARQAALQFLNRKRASTPNTPSVPSSPAPLTHSNNANLNVRDINSAFATAKAAVINVTVDSDGVRIRPDSDKIPAVPCPPTSTPSNTPCVSRHSSRHSISRASDKTRNEIRSRLQQPSSPSPPDDKENAPTTESTFNSNAKADFYRRRSSRNWQKTNATVVPPTASSDEWDGSMPRRKSSRSFLQRNAIVESRASVAAISNSKPNHVLTTTSLDDGVKQMDLNKEFPIEPKQSHAKENVSLNHVEELHQPSKSKQQSVNKTFKPRQSESALSIDNVPQQPKPQPQPQAECQVAKKKLEGHSHKETSRSKMPNCGSWCDDCAGVGLTVAALLTQREKEFSAAPDSGEDINSQKKTGWRSVVLGDGGRSKLEKENARLTKENAALFDVVLQLQKRFNDLRKKDSA